MRAKRVALALLGAGLLLPLRVVSGQHSPPPPLPTPTPYADIAARPYEYHGPRRDLVEPGDLSEVRIGLFAPEKPAGGGSRSVAGLSLRRGAELAVAEANAAGGYRGMPFVLVQRSDDQLWGSAREVVALVYEDEVWAVIGGVGGQSAHIAEQVIAKVQVPLISPASSDSSLTQVNIPWMFRCQPGDEAMVELLVRHLFREQGHRRVVALADLGSESRLRLAELEKAARRLGTPLSASLHYDPGDPDLDRQLRMIAACEADAVVLWGEPEGAARLLRGLQERGLGPQVYGGPGLATASFPSLAGELAEGVTVVAPCDLGRDDPQLTAFRKRYIEFHGEPPDTVAAYTYDATRMVIAAIRNAGLNRARIRDALAASEPFAGVTGTIHFDGTGSNTTPPVLLKALQ